MSILSGLLKISILMLVAVVVCACLQMCKVYYAMGFYRKQGIRTYFDPLLGLFGVFLRKRKDRTRRLDEHVADFVKNDYERGAIVHSGIACERPTICLLTAEYVREFFAQEDKFVRKSLIPIGEGVVGFFDRQGPTVQKERNLFQEVFHYEKVKSLVPSFLREIEKGLSKFIEVKKITKNSYTNINLSEILDSIVFKMSLILIFSNEDLPEDSAEVQIAMNAKAIVESGLKLMMNPMISLFPQLFRAFPFLNSGITDMLKIDKKQKVLLTKFVAQKETELLEGKSAFDRIMIYNKKCKEEGRLEDIMSINSIMGIINGLSFASFDTSLNTAILNLCVIAERPDIKEKLDKIADEIYDKDGITTADIADAHEELSMYIKEALRLESPILSLVGRIAVRDVNIKDIRVRKGDEVLIFLAPLMLDTKYFSDASTFQFDRFSKENKKKYGYPKFQIPTFGLGKRACIGRNLGELTAKLLLTTFCRRFEIMKPGNVQYYDTVGATRCAENPFVNLKLK